MGKDQKSFYAFRSLFLLVLAAFLVTAVVKLTSASPIAMPGTSKPSRWAQEGDEVKPPAHNVGQWVSDGDVRRFVVAPGTASVAMPGNMRGFTGSADCQAFVEAQGCKYDCPGQTGGIGPIDPVADPFGYTCCCEAIGVSMPAPAHQDGYTQSGLLSISLSDNVDCNAFVEEKGCDWDCPGQNGGIGPADPIADPVATSAAAMGGTCTRNQTGSLQIFPCHSLLITMCLRQ